MLHYEIIVIGTGPVGLTLSLMLAKQGKQVCILDAGSIQDGRVLALSYASYEMLDSLGVWPSECATPINTVNISHQGLGVTNITCESINLPHLGYTISYTDLCKSLLEEVLCQANILFIKGLAINVVSGEYFSSITYTAIDGDKNVSCDLVVLADGGKIPINNIKYNEFDYKQKAIVAHIKTGSIINLATAYERFTSNGQLVLLPYMDHYIVVWAVDSAMADKYQQNPSQFIIALNDVFTNRLGGATLLGNLFSFPLHLQVAKQKNLQRAILLGNSAQTVHPVSAQGLNLGLRDVLNLSQLLSKYVDLKTSCDLSLYHKLREKDTSFVINLTHNLVKFLESKSKVTTNFRSAGIIGLSNIPKLQNILANSLIFGV